jgi:cell division protein FtsB
MKTVATILLILLGLLQYRLWTGSGNVSQVKELEKKKESLQHDIAILEERNRSLAAEVIDLKTGLEAIEERARSEMGMIKDNETFYQIVDMPDTASNIVIDE